MSFRNSTVIHLIDSLPSLVEAPLFLESLACAPNLEDDVFIYAISRSTHIHVDSLLNILSRSGRSHLIPYVKTEEKTRNGDVDDYLTPGSANYAASAIISRGGDANDIISIVENNEGVCDFIDENGCNLLMLIAIYIPHEEEVFMHVYSNTTNLYLKNRDGDTVFDILESNNNRCLLEKINQLHLSLRR